MRYLHLYNMAFGWVSQASLLQQLHGWDMPWVLWQWVYKTKFDFTSAISPLVPYRPRVSYSLPITPRQMRFCSSIIPQITTSILVVTMLSVPVSSKQTSSICLVSFGQSTAQWADQGLVSP